MEIKIKVRGQVATCAEKNTLTASSGVLSAVFDFDETWDGMAKTALFTRNGVTETRLLRDDKCLVPDDLIKNGGLVVSVIGAVDGKILTTTNQCAVILYLSGYIPGITIGKPDEDVFTDILDQMAEHNKKAEAVQEQADQVKASEEAAQMSADAATESARKAKESEITAKSYESSTLHWMKESNRHMNAAEKAKASAEESAAAAQKSMDEASNVLAVVTSKATTVEQNAEIAGTAANTATENARYCETLSGNVVEYAFQAYKSEENAKSYADAANIHKIAAQTAMDSARDACENAENAQAAAEKARDEAMDIASGDYATKSELRDAVSGLATEEYVRQNGGKIQSVSVNGVAQTIDDSKNVNITVPTKVSQLENDNKFLTEHQDISGKADKTELILHTVDGAVHITAAERTKWNQAVTDVDTLSGEIADQQEQIDVLRLQGMQQTPLVPQGNTTEEQLAWLNENGDTTKTYKLKDGFLYEYGEKTEVVGGALVPNFTNLKDQCYFNYDQRYSHSAGGYKGANGSGSAIVVPVPSGVTSLTIYVQGAAHNGSYSAMYAGTGTNPFTYTDTVFSSGWANTCKVADKSYVIPVTKSSNATSVLFHLEGLEASAFNDLIVTVNEPIEYKESTDTVVVKGFVNTGQAFIPADYELRIIEVEESTEENLIAIANNTKRIKELEEKTVNVKVEFEPADYINSVHCPVQLPANGETGSDFNLHEFTQFGNEFHAYYDDLVNRYPHYLVREFLGKDTSGVYDMYRYIAGKHYYKAWYKENYPRMYAWKNGDTVIYSVSISPRIGDVLYSTAYIGTAYGTVTAVSATNRSRMVNGLEFVRYETGDIEPTVRYTPAYNPNNYLLSKGGNAYSSDVTIDGNILTAGESKYIRYPFGDLKKDWTKPIHMTIITNEHGGNSEPAIPTLVTARLIRDLCNGQCSSDNPIYRYLRDNVQITVITPVNPYGLHVYATHDTDENGNPVRGYHNVNNININRNYDTPGWDYCYEHQDVDNNAYVGPYPGSENETQYVMNTMVDSKTDIAMSVHTRACTAGNIIVCNYQGQNPNGDYTKWKIDEMFDDMKASYNLNFVAYSPLYCPPETTCKSPSFITQIGAYGGIIEFQCHEPSATEEERVNRTTMFTATCMEQNYSLLLKFIAMWLSDYLEQA